MDVQFCPVGGQRDNSIHLTPSADVTSKVTSSLHSRDVCLHTQYSTVYTAATTRRERTLPSHRTLLQPPTTTYQRRLGGARQVGSSHTPQRVHNIQRKCTSRAGDRTHSC